MMKKLLLPIGIILCSFSCGKKSDNTVTEKPPVTTETKRTYTITPNTVDADANDATKKLYTYMVSQFGKKIISGQTDQDHFEYVKTVTANSPVIRDYDMQPYSPMYSYSWANGGFAFGPYNESPNVPNAINWYNSTAKKAIIAFQWHWHSPSGGVVGTNTFDTENTTYDVTKAVITGTQENTDALRDIDAIAVQLKKLSDAGVPMLWRPLHEAGGTWFWWSAKGPEAYKALWNMVYDRIVNYHHLHNLIWVWTGDDTAWYPGNSKVDILGIDSYPGDHNYTINKEEFDKVYTISGGNKLIAMSENGPIPDINATFTGDVTWSYFMSWYDVTIGNTDQHLKDVFTNPKVITLENYK